MPAEGNFQGAGSTFDFTANGDQLGRGMGQFKRLCALAYRAGRRHVPPWKRFRLSHNWTSPEARRRQHSSAGLFFGFWARL
jgi:hypothetical protein